MLKSDQLAPSKLRLMLYGIKSLIRKLRGWTIPVSGVVEKVTGLIGKACPTSMGIIEKGVTEITIRLVIVTYATDYVTYSSQRPG